ncbi:MAG: hypothetical protein ACE149_18825 [Armatimonadota bacterium]
MEQIAVGRSSYPPDEVVKRAQKASGWFAAIAIFSCINSLLVLFKAKVSFVIGLGATQVVDALIMAIRDNSAGAAQAVLTLVALAINLAIIGVIVLIWWLSKRGSAAAYLTGMVLYLLDTLIFLLVGDWVGVGFHVFFLAMLWGGYGFVRAWARAQRLLAASQAPQEAPPYPV